MSLENKFPFSLSNAFVISSKFQRKPEISEPVNVNLVFQVRIREEAFPDKLQIDLEVATVDEQDLELSVELIGLFERLKGEPEPDPNKTMEFVEQRALFILWAIMNQYIKQVTANMGMEPLNFKIPSDFKLTPEMSEQS